MCQNQINTAESIHKTSSIISNIKLVKKNYLDQYSSQTYYIDSIFLKDRRKYFIFQ